MSLLLITRDKNVTESALNAEGVWKEETGTQRARGRGGKAHGRLPESTLNLAKLFDSLNHGVSNLY